MSKDTTQTIPIPLKRRFRTFRLTILPILIWVGVGASSYLIATRGSRTAGVEGVVEAQQTDLAAIHEGTIDQIAVRAYSFIPKGAIIASLDTADIDQELAVLDREAARVRALLLSERASHEASRRDEQQERVMDARRLALDSEQARMQTFDRLIQLESDRIELRRLTTERDRQERLASIGTDTRADMEDATYRAEALERAIREQESALEEARRQQDLADARLAEYTSEDRSLGVAPVEAILAPLERELDVIEAQRALLEMRRSQRVLRAPHSGVVTQLFAGEGESVLRGQIVASVAKAQAQTVTAYLDERAGARDVLLGDRVVVRPRREGATGSAAGTVTALGPVMVPLPERFLRDPQRMEYARPVEIRLAAGHELMPGERVTVKFVGGRPDLGTGASASGIARGGGLDAGETKGTVR